MGECGSRHPEDTLVWKDTVLVRTAEPVDILFDVAHPGRWMAHCHIAEHQQSGMMFNFNVPPEGRECQVLDQRASAPTIRMILMQTPRWGTAASAT